jgi:murein DD-endopeptidase MepM/ murein hydrolase activator NlpD
LKYGLIGVAAVCACALAFGQSGSSKTTTKIKSQIKTLDKQQAKERQKLRVVRNQMRDVKGTIEDLDDQLESIESKYHATQEKLENSQAEQKRLSTELVSTEKELTEKSAVAKERLRYIRMRGEAGVISAFLGASSIRDLAGRRFVYSRIANRDRDLFEDVRKLRDTLVVKKKRTDQLVVEVHDLLSETRAQHAQYNEVREDKQTKLNQLSDKAAEMEAYVRKLDREEDELRSKMESFSMGAGPGTPRPGRLLMPTRGRMGSPFGMRTHPILRRSRMHWGQDIAAPSGTPIYAAAAGNVVYSSRQRGYGNVVILQHGGNMTTLYAHCSVLLVRVGQKVRQGQMIARVGSTGLSTGPHLHFEVAVNGTRVNPRRYL